MVAVKCIGPEAENLNSRKTCLHRRQGIYVSLCPGKRNPVQVYKRTKELKITEKKADFQDLYTCSQDLLQSSK